MDQPPPRDIIERFGHLPDVVHRGKREWSSACPTCGGARGGRDPSDRFRMWERPGLPSNFWCRRCGYAGFTDDNRERKKITPERIIEIEEMRQRLAAQEESRLQAKIAELQQTAYWQGYHDAMTDNERGYWRRHGIADSLQDWFKLGYVGHRTFYNGNDQFSSPALTIPHFDVGWEPVNIQYRIIKPPAGVGKYRYTAGLPAPLFLADPEAEPSGNIILVEGAKKAIVVWAHMGSKYQVVGVPSKMPSEMLINRLNKCQMVYIVLDPDAYTGRGSAVNRIAKMLAGRCRITKLPVKPDDLFTLYGGDSADMQTFLNMAARA